MHEVVDTPTPVLQFEGFALDVSRRALSVGGEPVELRPKSFDVLVLLVHAAGRAVPKHELLQSIWPNVVVTEESLTRCISDVRHALRDTDQRIIKTLPRFGYQFVAPVARHAAGVGAAADERGHSPAATRTARAARPVWWRSRRALAASLALIVAGALGWHLLAERPAPQGPSGAAPRLSIVVMPLASRNGSDRQDYLAEALTEEITVDLSRIPDSFVIARSSADSYRGRGVDARQAGRELGVRYVLEGRVERRDDHDIRLSLQLVDAESGRALWAERFEGQLSDLAALHRQVTGTVAQTLHLQLVESELARVAQRPAADASALDQTLQAWSVLRRRTPAAVADARELLQRVVLRDAQSALAWSLLADTYTADVGFRSLHLRGATREQWLQRAAQASERAYALDPNHPHAVGSRATVLSLQGLGEQALAMTQRQIALNRNDAKAWFRLSYTYATLGRAEESIQAGHEAIRLSPRDSELCGFYVVIAAAHLYLGQDAQALEWARKSALEVPSFSVARSWIASAAANLGDTDTARAALAEFRRLQPDYTVGSFRAENLCANQLCRGQRERYFAGLSKAGLPQ